MKLNNSLLKLFSDFGLLEAEIPVPQAPVSAQNTEIDYEKDTIDKLDRSAKFDEIDTVTFGLETDDGKIVKVYVNAEQATEFEKALSDMLGQKDDIEEILNELSKNFEIVDVEWPDADPEASEDSDDEMTDGSEVLDQKVYKKDDKEDGVKESLYGENVALQILESTGTIESRFNTSTQLMVYHAIVDLGVPEIALARSAYRAAIIKGIKECANEIQAHPSMKVALKAFIKRAMDFEAEAEKNSETRGRENMNHAIEDRAGKDKVKEEAKPFKIAINEERCTWDFSVADDDLKIACDSISVTLDPEETEKLMKGVSNRDAVVVRDIENQKKKVVFSPRGTNILVKLVGSAEGYMMTSKDVDELLDTISPDKEKVEESVSSAKKIAASLNKKTFERHDLISKNPVIKFLSNQGATEITWTSKNWHYDGDLGDKQEGTFVYKGEKFKYEFSSHFGMPLTISPFTNVNEAVKTQHPAYKFKYDHSKELIDNVEKFMGKEIKPGRNELFGFPVDIEDSDGTFLDCEAVDKDACSKVAKAFRAAGFAVKINMAGTRKEFSIDAPAKTTH